MSGRPQRSAKTDRCPVRKCGAQFQATEFASQSQLKALHMLRAHPYLGQSKIPVTCMGCSEAIQQRVWTSHKESCVPLRTLAGLPVAPPPPSRRDQASYVSRAAAEDTGSVAVLARAVSSHVSSRSLYAAGSSDEDAEGKLAAALRESNEGRRRENDSNVRRRTVELVLGSLLPSDADSVSESGEDTDEQQPRGGGGLEQVLTELQERTSDKDVHPDFNQFLADDFSGMAYADEEDSLDTAAVAQQQSPPDHVEAVPKAAHGNARWVRYKDSAAAKKIFDPLVRLPRSTADEILQVMHHLSPDEVPPSMFVLRECAKFWYSLDKSGMEQVPQEKLPAQLQGDVEIWYRPIKDVVLEILDEVRKNPAHFSWLYEPLASGAPLEKCCQTERFRQCVQDILGEGPSPNVATLLLALFVDEYERAAYRTGKDTGVYWTSANNNECDAVLGAIITSRVNIKGDDYRELINVLVREVIEPAMKELFDGLEAQVRVGDRDLPIRGCLYCLICDDIGIRDLLGLLGPRSNHPSRFVTNHVNTFGSTDVPLVYRKDTDCNLWDDFYRSTTEREKTLADIGLHPIKPALLRVPGMRAGEGEGFFQNQNICKLHQSSLGEWKRFRMAMLLSANVLHANGLHQPLLCLFRLCSCMSVCVFCVAGRF
jgi:hypothetical protein